MVALAGLNTAHNLSFYALPAAWVLSIAPHFYAIALFNKERAAGTPAWDNCNPQKNLDLTKDAKLSPAMQERFKRAEAAQNNGFIGLGYFAAAVVAGNLARIEPKFLNSMAGLYLASRVVYNYLYINNTSPLLGNARSVSYLTGIGACFALFIQAGNKLSKGYVSL